MTTTSFVQVPDSDHYWLRNVRIPTVFLGDADPVLSPIAALAASPQLESLVAADIEMMDGRIARLLPQGSAPASEADVPACDLHQGLVWPCFVDVHTHLDKGHTWLRTPNLNGTFEQALISADKDRRAYWSAEDLYQRMEFALRCAYAHGTRALRTHLDAHEGQAEISFQVFDQLRQAWADRITLQAVSLVPPQVWATDEGAAVADVVARYGGVLGGVAYPHPEMATWIDRAFTLAQERGLDLDFHTDESLDPDAITLRQVAQTKVRHQFQGRVVCGHCCSLSIQSAEAVEETLRWLKQAEVSVVSLPMCNLFLQDRQPGRMPRYRGVTLLPELQQAGIPVAVASDNCRDPFYAYGDHDGLEVFTQSVRIGQLDRPIGDWPKAVTQTPAAMMGLAERGTIGVGEPADLVLFRARNFTELLSRPQSDRGVIRRGRSIDTALPNYAELDGLVPH